MSRKHSTLLKEEIDDEVEGSGGDKKKREKEKEGVEKKKKSHKKGGVERSEGYYNDVMSTKQNTAISTAAVNPSAEMVTSPVHSQPSAVIPPPLQPPPQSHQSHRHHVAQQNYNVAASQISPNAQAYAMQGVQGQVGVQQIPGVQQKQGVPGQVGVQQIPGVQQIHNQQVAAGHWQQQAAPQRILPPPSTQHVQILQQPFQQIQSPQQPHPQVQFTPQVQQVQYHPQPPQQGYYSVVQYPHGVAGGPNQVPGQVVPYQTHPIAVHPGMVADDQGNVWTPTAPQSPTNQGQIQHEGTWPQHAEGNWSGQPPGTADPNWRPGMVPAQDQQREGNWAAFDGSPPFETKAQLTNRKEITWKESPDNSSSDEEIERSSSPELAGEEGEGLLRAPSLTSFAESTSSIEEEGEDNPWKIQLEQQEYYTKQFKRLQPDDGGVIKGPKARDFFLKSNLPTETLSKIWHLSDINKDNALDLNEFCIAMHLVVAIRHGLELPSTLPDVLLYHRCLETANDDLSGDRTTPLPENVRQDNMDTVHEVSKPWARFRPSSYSDRSKILNHISFDHSVSKPITYRDSKEDIDDARPRSLSDPSINEDQPSEVSRKTSMPSSNVSKPNADGTLSPGPGPTVSIERPRAVAKFSLLDAQPGQLLPPPSGKFGGWTPSKPDRKDSYSGESDEDTDEDSEEAEEESRPLSPGQAMPGPMPAVPEDSTSESPRTPPSSPLQGSQVPKPVFPDSAQVTRRLSKKSNERPRSAGDLNDVKPLSPNDSSAGSTPTNSSIGSDGKKEPPPPPPPRNKKGHSRSSSLDLNKLFASKGKESRANTIGSPSSSHSSQHSQNSDIAISSKTTEPKNEEEDGEIKKSKEDVAKEENFADFSNFETLVKAQSTVDETQMNVPTGGRTHRRSLSLDQCQDYLPKATKPNNNEVVTRTNNGPAKVQEALPRPVPKLKPPGSPPVKLLKLPDRTPKKEGSEERKLKTEPPKVIVKPLTKKGKLQNNIRDLKDKNHLLSRLNSELQQECKEAMEQRISLELKLERLKPFTSK